jgi:hypothetical protein
MVSSLDDISRQDIPMDNQRKQNLGNFDIYVLRKI